MSFPTKIWLVANPDLALANPVVGGWERGGLATAKSRLKRMFEKQILIEAC